MAEPDTLTLRFSEETLQVLRTTAERLGISMEQLAEAVMEHGLALLSSGLEQRLDRIVELLRSDRKRDLKKDIEQFAHSEVVIDDPLRAHRVSEDGDLFGIEAVFGRRPKER